MNQVNYKAKNKPQDVINRIEAFAIQSKRIIGFGDSVWENLEESLKEFEFKLGDILIVASKVVSMEQNDAVKLDDVSPSEWAMELAKDADLDPRVAELVIQESGGEIYGSVWKAILAKTSFGLGANAGIDLSNVPKGYALLLPKNPDKFALDIHLKLKQKYNLSIPVILADSRTIPLRRGTSGVTIGLAGMEPIIDERGHKDLYGYKMQITTRAIADNVATVANLLMGETDERIPFSVVRGVEFIQSEQSGIQTALMPPDQCIYFAPFLKTRRKLDG